MRVRIERFSTIIGITLLAARLAARGLSSKLQNVISAPILHLAQAARSVSAERGYAIRAVKGTTFFIRLPLEPEAKPEEEKRSCHPLQG